MPVHPRNLFPYAACLVGVAALGYAVTFGRLPPADFTFSNGTEVQSIDSAKVTGVPEHRIIAALFEGLYRQNAETLEPEPAVAQRHDLSPDRKTYTFHLRDTARWSDSSPVTAGDFVWSWQRVLHPEMASEYAYQLYYVKNGEKYNSAKVEIGDPVEVELDDRRSEVELFPRGTIVRGTLREIAKPPEPKIPENASKEEKSDLTAKWKSSWIHSVEVDGKPRRFCKSKELATGNVTHCLHLLLDFDQVGVRAVDDRTLRVELGNPTPYFPHIAAFYTTFPVNRTCVEKYGRDWTKRENIVTNGPYHLEFRRLRDRIRLRKSSTYWNAADVGLNVVDALAIASETTALNMYANGQIDWAETIPLAVMPEMMARHPDEIRGAPTLTTYMYRFNTHRPPLDDPRVRRALSMAVNKREICERVLQGGEVPARSLVPDGMRGYEQAHCPDYNLDEARRLLAEAGFAGGKGCRTLEILYNDQGGHKTIAEKIQSDWQRELGIRTELRALEWGTFLDTCYQMKYDIARQSWMGDYPDPNTFLDLFVTEGTNNFTGWSNPRYDQLIRDAAAESDPTKRLEIFHEAETLLMAEQPILPIYFAVSKNLVRPYVKGFTANILDIHPLSAIRIDPEEKASYWRARRTP